MPCYLVVTILLEDHSIVERAASELGLVEGKDYMWDKGTVRLYDPSKQGLLKQRYGLLQSESLARRKGFKIQRKVQEDGTVQLTLMR
mgnify:CR=1 FL=1